MGKNRAAAGGIQTKEMEGGVRDENAGKQKDRRGNGGPISGNEPTEKGQLIIT